jgi:regulatory protein
VPPEDEVTLGPPADPESVARSICLRLLSQRARTRTELSGALDRKGVPPAVAARVLDRFTEVGLIDDGALASGYALAQHRERGLAARAVAMKLRKRGLAEETVQAAVEPIDADSERTAARAVAERRLRSLSGLAPTVQARRLVGLLGRRGYAPGLAHQVVREVLREHAIDCARDGALPGDG